MTLKSKSPDNNSCDDQKTEEQQRPEISPMAEIYPSELSKHKMQGGEKLIRLPELLRTIGVSRATAYRYMVAGRLPRPMKLSSRCIAWKASAINEWLAHLQPA